MQQQLRVLCFASACLAAFLTFSPAYLYYILCVITPVLDSPFFLPSSSCPLPSSFLLPCIYLGTIMFAFGWIMQSDAHWRLGELRKGKQKTDTEGGSTSSSSASSSSSYSIPFGSLFSLVSMPHYFCEMVEYAGLWMISGGKWSQL
jgi:uncharacterized membrane protein YgcG